MFRNTYELAEDQGISALFLPVELNAILELFGHLSNICGNEFRRYGNGGDQLRMIPRCPKCGGPASES